MAVRSKNDIIVYAAGLGEAPSRIAEFYGTSLDSKPTTGILNGSTFVEVDTGKLFLFNETAGEWVEVQ